MHKRALAGTLSVFMITGALSALSVGSAEAATQPTVTVDATTLAGGATSDAGLFSAQETDYANTGSSGFVAGPDGATGPGSLELRTEASHSGSQNDKIYAGKTLLDVPVSHLDALAYKVRTSPANNDATAPYLQMYVSDSAHHVRLAGLRPERRRELVRHGRCQGRLDDVRRHGLGRQVAQHARPRQPRRGYVHDPGPVGRRRPLPGHAPPDRCRRRGRRPDVRGRSWSGYRAQLDQLVIGISGDTTTYDFGNGLGDCLANTDVATETATLTADCSTSTTLQVADGWTIDGNGHTITAVETACTSFTGAVVQNAGTSMSIRDLTVATTPEWANAGKNSGGNLAGIRFKNAFGSLSHVTVTGISHGNGVQEGNGIDVDNIGGTTNRVVTADHVSRVAATRRPVCGPTAT